MAGFGNLVQKAFYLGIGAASYAGEKATNTFKDLQGQAQKIVNELVERGELTAEEGQQLFNKMMQQAQAPVEDVVESPRPTEPRRIEILDADEDTPSPESQEAEALREQVDALREKLEDLKRKSD
ncbi:MAG: hypothetical protein AAFX01_11380 [Cyanobacteria bacterium J06638_28]